MGNGIYTLLYRSPWCNSFDDECVMRKDSNNERDALEIRTVINFRAHFVATVIP